MPQRHSRTNRRGLLAVAAGLLLVGTTPLAAGAAPQSGFKTLEPSMLVPGADAPLDTTIKPLITVGDMIGDYRYEAIPDGISIMSAGKNSAHVFVNHETSTVPFRFAGSPTAANSENDFLNSLVSDLVIHKGGGILSAELIIENGAGYQRFCSNYLATSEMGFARPVLFNNEEGIDWVWEDGTSWTGNLENVANARQIGVAVAYDVENDTYAEIWGMGRFNHENNVAIPGYGQPVLLSGDDAFVSNPMQSQVYQYLADDADGVMADEGTLYAFVSDVAGVDDYYDFARGTTSSVNGHFIEVPREIATGKNPDGSDMISSEVPAVFANGSERGDPYVAPPSDGSWQRPPGSTTDARVPVTGIDGPQWILEQWSDRNNVFQFVRIEDIAWDKRPHMSNVVYLADSGRGLGGNNAPTVEDAAAPPYPQPFTSSNGRIWRMELNATNPSVVNSLSILIEGDDAPVKTLGEIHQPDNLETTLNALYVTEDPGSSQQFVAADQGLANATTARLWQYKLVGGALAAVAKVDQSADEGPTDEDGTLSAAGRWGAWETTGILDVSQYFGPGKFLINVQAHTLWIDIASGPTNIDGDADPDWTWKREGGQLVLLTIPGG